MSKSKIDKAIMIIGIGVPAAWLLVPLLGYVYSQGPGGADRGFVGMAAVYTSMSAVVWLHLLGFLSLCIIAGIKLKSKEKVGKELALAFSYYLLPIGFLILHGGINRAIPFLWGWMQIILQSKP